MKPTAAVLTTLITLVSTSALAAPPAPYVPVPVDTAIQALTELGATPERKTDDYGDPLLTFVLPQSGLKASMYFYDCADNKCGSMQLHAGFSMTSPPSYEVLNKWNGSKRWARGYRGDSGDVHLETDLMVTPQDMKGQVRDFVTTYEFLIKDFATFVGFN